MFTIVSTTEHVYVIGLRTHLLGSVTLAGDQTHDFANSHDVNLMERGVLKVALSVAEVVEKSEKEFAKEVVEASKVEALAPAAVVEQAAPVVEPKEEPLPEEPVVIADAEAAAVVEQAAPVVEPKEEPLPEEPVVIADAEAAAVVEVAPKKRR